MASIGADDIRNYYVGTKFQFTYYFRSRRFIGLLIFSILITILILFLDLHYDYSALKAENSAAFLYNYLSNGIIAYFAILAAFFGGDMISMDLGTSTAFYTLVQPIKRSRSDTAIIRICATLYACPYIICNALQCHIQNSKHRSGGVNTLPDSCLSSHSGYNISAGRYKPMDVCNVRR